jgi:uncharacterized protein (TIGR03437 family)
MRSAVAVSLKSLFVFCCIPGALAQTGTWYIDTIAGTDRPVNDGGKGISALLNSPGGIVTDAAGNTIFADSGNHRVRQISPAGTITTIVGTGIPGYSGDGGPATAARIITPQGLALDASGNLYIADYGADVVRKVSPEGNISTVAGNGANGNTGSTGKATAAALSGPFGLAVDKPGNLYIAEYFNNAVRKVTPDGNIQTFTGSKFTNAAGLAIDAAGAVYISASGENRIYKASAAGSVTVFAGNGSYDFAGDGGAATAASLASPWGLAFDASGNLWVGDTGNNRIRRVATDGSIQTVIGSGSAGITNFSSDPTSASVYRPSGVAIDAKGLVFWAEAGNNRIRYYNPANRQITETGGFTPALSSSGGPTSLLLFNPAGMATDAAGNLFIADTTNNVIRKITPGGAASVVAGTGSANFNGDVGTATTINLTQPQGVSVDAQGNIYIADTGSGRVRKLDTTGRITTVMGAGTGLPFSGTFAGNAFLFAPIAVVANPAGGFLTVDQLFGIVASVDALGTITLIPTSTVNYLFYPGGIALSGSTVYIADTYDNRILKYTGGSNISVLAGTGAPGYTGDNGPATKATLFLPGGVAADANGNVYVADTLNSAIRMIDKTGKITTIAGNGKPGFSGDKGVAQNAQLAFPSSISVDGAGNLLVADQGNQRIRQLQMLQVQPDLTITTDSATKTANHGSSLQIPLTLTSLGGFAGSAALSVSAPGGLSFQFSPSGAVNVAAGQTVNVTVTATIPATTAPGTYTLGFTVNAGTVQHTANVALEVTNLPQFPVAGVASNGVSPGEIIAIYGQDLGPANLALGSFDANNILATQVGGTQVLFDGKPAPLIYSAAGQLSAIVPYATDGKTTTQVQIQYNGRTSAAIPVPVVDAAPGIFNIPASSQAAALNADLSVNNEGNPAEKGSIVVLFATGEGQTSPHGTDGRIATDVFPKPQLPVSVTIGGEQAELLYAGAAPFEVAGVLQLNVRVPAGTPAGAAPVVLRVGTRIGTGVSTISVR